jgi:GT2 family glycosyltransferase
MNPSVTVLVTVKNSKNTIRKCLASLFNLDYSNKKIYIIDAFSTDGTYEILKEFEKKIKLEQLGGNPPIAYNHALKKIDTEFVALTDGDCIVKKDWLKILISGFKSKDILAVGGFCKTPKNLNNLQKIIGIELEDRFRHFSEYVPRLPTMNLCIRTEIAKKLKFDERLDVAYDTDFGYRLTKIGRMRYTPKAIIYHYHRTSWRGFFKQQFTYGKFVPILYLKHKKRFYGDHISKSLMGLQLLAFVTGTICLFLSVLNQLFLLPAIILFLLLFSFYFSDILRMKVQITDINLFLTVFFIRTVGWSLGLLFSIKNVMRQLKWI